MDIQARLLQHMGPAMVDLVRLCAWLVVLMLIFVPLERIWPVRRQKLLRKSFGTDLAYYFLSGILPKLILVVPLSFVAAVVHRVSVDGLYPVMAELPFGVRLAAAMIVGETGFYWGHRWSHRIPWLWRFHAVHHSAEELDWLVGSRAHPVDMVFTRLCGMAPMYVLGLAQPMGNSVDLVPVLVTLLGTIWGFFVHSNVLWRLGWLERVIASPAFHHWHHTNDGPEYLDKNFAPMLPWVDQVFGTLYLPKGKWPAKYGTDTVVAKGMGGQLIGPFS
ncbi:MAG: sterol desaturase [Candidatus Solibacter sp.]|jgi:sterol desaturase/sphingolipid hydroxylase (fatty acid hydroxylase superfamily)|nr:sterol desaturase [Candidatus Solibacter sp.]